MFYQILSAIFGFFYFTNQFKKDNDTNWVFGKSNVVRCDKKLLVDEDCGIYLVVQNGVQVVCKGGVPIEEIVCGRGFALVEKILNSYICVACISYALVYHMDL